MAHPPVAQWGARATWHLYRAYTKAPALMPSASTLVARLRAQPKDGSGRRAVAQDVRSVLHALLPDLLRPSPPARVLLYPGSRYILAQASDAGSFIPARLTGGRFASPVSERLAAWIRDGVLPPFSLGEGCVLADPSRSRMERVVEPIAASVLRARAGLIPVALGLRVVPGISRDADAPWVLAFELCEHMVLRNAVFPTSVDASSAVRAGILLRCAAALDAALWPPTRS